MILWVLRLILGAPLTTQTRQCPYMLVYIMHHMRVHTWPSVCLCRPHQLRLAPGDAVAGDAAEVTASRDPDFGPCCALLLMLWRQHPLETIWEVLLRAHLHIHADTDQIFRNVRSFQSLNVAVRKHACLFTLRSVRQEGGGPCRPGPRHC